MVTCAWAGTAKQAITKIASHDRELIVIFDIARQQDLGADGSRERFQPLGLGVALIGKGHLRAVRRQGAGNAPGYGVVISNPHNEAAPTTHQARAVGTGFHHARSVPITFENQSRIGPSETEAVRQYTFELCAVDARTHDRRIRYLRVELVNVGAFRNEPALHLQ